MENVKTGQNELPENAYRELAPGEEYKPVLPVSSVFPEVTTYSVFWGLIMAAVFSAAAAYSGLKIGQVFEAAIPISIIAVGLSAALRKKNALGQNVIIQSIGASSGVIVAGAIFTIPGLYILQHKYPEIQVDFFQIFFASLFGGFLGILFLIPFRKYFVKEMHGKFPFPEATATTEILMTGEKGGSQAGILLLSGLLGGVYDFMSTQLRVWNENFTSKLLPYGDYLYDKAKMYMQVNVSALVFSFGYLVGLRYSLIIALGSILSWFVFIPLINTIGGIAAGPTGTNMFAALTPEAIFRLYVRPIGIGAIAMAGIIGIIRSSGVIGSAFKLAFAGLTGKNAGEEKIERTQLDMKMSTVFMLSIAVIGAIFIFLLMGVKITPWQATVALLTLVIISFLFTTVAANAIAIVGSNPVSGMTLMTLILSSFILVAAGVSGPTGMVSALIIGGIVCTALSMAGGFITDLKIGYWIGNTPLKQQKWKFLGTLVSAATVGVVIFVLNKAYGFVVTPLTPNPMVAPQANAMAAIIEPLLQPGAHIDWMLYIIGAIISLIMFYLEISPLAFALGMYLPLQLNTPLIVGGLLAHYINKSSKDEKVNSARNQRGTLIASGFIAGAALFGVLGAFLIFFGVNLDTKMWADGDLGSEWLALAMFALLIGYFIWDSLRAKTDK